MAGWGVQGLRSDPGPLARRGSLGTPPHPYYVPNGPLPEDTLLDHVSPVQRDLGVTAIKIGLDFLPGSPAGHDITWPHPSRPWGPPAAPPLELAPWSCGSAFHGQGARSVPLCSSRRNLFPREQKASLSCPLPLPSIPHFYFSNPMPVPARLCLHRREPETQEGEPTARRIRSWLFSWLSPILRSRTFTERVRLTPTRIPR